VALHVLFLKLDRPIIGHLLPMPIIRTARGECISDTATSAAAISIVSVMYEQYGEVKYALHRKRRLLS